MITNHFDNERRNLSNVTMMPIEYWISARIFRIRSSVAYSSLWPHLGCWRQRWLWMAWRWRPWWRTPQPWGTRVRPGSRDKLRFFFYRVHFKQILYIFFNNLYNNSYRFNIWDTAYLIDELTKCHCNWYQEILQICLSLIIQLKWIESRNIILEILIYFIHTFSLGRQVFEVINPLGLWNKIILYTPTLLSHTLGESKK